MSKIKLYRIMGNTLVVLGAAIFITSNYNPSRFQQVMANPNTELLPVVFGILGSLVFNVFIWAGLLALWRSEKIENPDTQPKCLKIIKPFAILTVVLIIITIFAVIIPNLLKGGFICNG